MPWELDVYLSLTMEYIDKQEEQARKSAGGF